MRWATTMAAGALMIEAVRMCAITFGMTPVRMVA
jgi:hypothetical protein